MQRTTGETPTERQDYWTTIIEQARRYPGGVTAFCKENGVSKDNYYQWFKRLRPIHPEWAEDLPVKRPTTGKKAQSATRTTEVEPKVSRRKFSKKEKERILRETDDAETGQVAAILRREGIYSSTLAKWRIQRKKESLEPQKRGRKSDPQAARIAALEAENAKLKKQIERKDMLLDLQKKIAQILETAKQQD